MTTKFTRHCQSAPERKCDRVPQCVLDCDFDSAGDDLPIKMLPDPPEWSNDPPEFHWSLVAWALLLVAGAFGIVGLVL